MLIFLSSLAKNFMLSSNLSIMELRQTGVTDGVSIEYKLVASASHLELKSHPDSAPPDRLV
jgi:hypothetical protein